MSTSDVGSGYFVRNRPNIHVDYAERPGDPALTMLREAQAGAYWAVRSHFTTRRDPALVVMPTGSGKTAVMTLLAFGLTRERLLIIAPTRFIVEQIEYQFKTLQVARDVGSLPDSAEMPAVHVVEHRLASSQAWMDLCAYDVVIATPHCAAPRFEGVCDPPTDLMLFDTMFIDEAHHWPAPTWDSLKQAFPQVRIVGLTATPYRNDKKPIPGEIVYSYPLARAIERGIYRPIEFIPVEGYGDEDQKDRSLAEMASAVWREKSGSRKSASGTEPGPKLLVHTARLAETRPLRRLYAELGVRLEIVSSEKSLRRNLAAISNVQQDRADGLLAVGMLGEGFDLPALQIAVLHRAYQSFPVTLQFIGRVCRMSGEQDETAILLAIPDDVEEHTKGLYDWDADWSTLIPNLADAAVDRERARREFVSDHWGAPQVTQEISLNSLRPSFAVTVYNCKGQEVDIARRPTLNEKTTMLLSTFSKDGRQRVVITRTVSNPVWARSTSLLDVAHDLSIHYRTGELLFEFTTSPEIALCLRKSFVTGTSADTALPIPLLEKTRVEQVISQRVLLQYFHVGMRRAALTSSSVPTYKTMAGTHVENCVLETDGQFFAVGHVFGRVDWDGSPLAIGVSGDSSRIWAAARGHLLEFTAWCDVLAQTLANQEVSPVPHLNHLMKPVWVTHMPARPYTAEFDRTFYEHLAEGLRLECRGKENDYAPVDSPSAYELSVATDSDWHYLIFHAGGMQLKLRCLLEPGRYFELVPQPQAEACLVKVPEGGRYREYELADYLTQFPPTLFLVDGSAMVGPHYYMYESPEYNLPAELFSRQDWDALGCDITIEDMAMVRSEQRRSELEAAGLCSVLAATASIVRERLVRAGKGFVLCDHGSGEIADYVALEPEVNTVGREALRIHLYHCKAATTKAPAARQEDAFEVLGQARKCVRWLHRTDLYEVIRQRLKEGNAVELGRKGIALGSRADFETLVNGRLPRSASYSIHAVQPGFAIPKITEWRDPSLRVMFLSLWDELRGQGIGFEVIGS